MLQGSRDKQTPRGPQRMRVGPRAYLACVYCKTKKLRCDDSVPSCANCQRFNQVCLVEDAATKRYLPRNYLETLEARVGLLEEELRQARSDTPAGPNASSTPSQVAEIRGTGRYLTAPKVQNEDDGATDLTSKAGMLDLRTDGVEPYYLGSTSVFAFSRLIHPLLRRAMPGTNSDIFGFDGGEESTSSACPLPDYEFGVTLSNAYFENIHPQYPFLHEPTFREWERRLLARPETVDHLQFEPTPLFFLNMVYAISALLLPNAGLLPQRFYTSAQLYIDNVLSRDNLEAIQAILCCAMYSLRSATGPSIWKLSGLALRQCIELGYHRSTKRFSSSTDPLRLELRKRVFWCAYSIDCSAALTLGRPLGLHLQEVDAEFPMDIDDFSITEAGIVGSPRNSPDDPPTAMTTAIHVFKLRCLWARMHASLYSDVSASGSDSPDRRARVQELRHELDGWIESIPPIPTRSGAALSIFASRGWYDLNYSGTIILLYGNQLTIRHDIKDEVFVECARAAENICRGYRRQYIGKSVNYTWGSLHVLFMAGLTYLHCLWASSTVREAVRYDEMSRTLADCQMLLVAIAERWKSVGPYRDMFEALARRTMTMMVDKHQPQHWTLPTPAETLEQEASENLVQWAADIADVGMSDGIDKLLTNIIDEFMSQERNPA